MHKKVDDNHAPTADNGRITVSVASHGQRDLVAALLEQLADLRDTNIARVIVVHNLPSADLSKPPRATFELVQLHNSTPLGFATNHNLAFAQSSTPWFAVLNPDLEFRFGNPFPALLAAAADQRLGAVAPALVQPGTLHVEPPRGSVTPTEIIRRRLPGWKPPTDPAWLVGAFLMIRAEAFRMLGGFDESFRLYCEDVDLGLRLRDAGWHIKRVEENARVLHQTQRHSHRRIKYTMLHASSLLRLWKKHARRAPLRQRKNSTPRNKRTNITADAGPSKVATSKYSTENINETDLSTMLNDFWQTAANHQGPGKIDHVWFDSDR